MRWYPTECDVSIRPGWFYHESEDGLIKSVDALVGIYLRSVGRNSNLLLNVPPDRYGLISDRDIAALTAWRKRLDADFGRDLLLRKSIQSSSTRGGSRDSPANCLDDDEKSFWTTDPGMRSAELTIDVGEVQRINAVKLEEAIQYGQRISAFTLYVDAGGTWSPIASGTTVGRTRILTFPTIVTDKVRISIDDAKAPPAL
jgi:alpha-L-fucosidase